MRDLGEDDGGGRERRGLEEKKEERKREKGRGESQDPGEGSSLVPLT